MSFVAFMFQRMVPTPTFVGRSRVELEFVGRVRTWLMGMAPTWAGGRMQWTHTWTVEGMQDQVEDQDRARSMELALLFTILYVLYEHFDCATTYQRWYVLRATYVVSTDDATSVLAS